MYTQDDIGHDSRSENAFVSSDASELLPEARRLLRDVLPKPVRHEHEWAASLMMLETTPEQFLRALQLQAGHASPVQLQTDANVNVHVHEVYLSIASVVGLIDDGARTVSRLPLHTGRYVRVTVANGDRTLATLWFPSVPVFRVSPRLMA